MKWCLLLSLTFLLILAAYPAQGYPNGAPRNRKVCKTLKPHHHGSHGETSSPPYSITPSKTKIAIGGSVNVTISAHTGNSYKGFIMQARPRMIGNVGYIKPIGSFKIIDTTHSKTLDCLSAEKNTVTHTNPDEKTATSFIWTPPDKYQGPVYFRASFVKDFSTFWLNVSSKIVVGDSDTVNPMSTEVDFQEEVGTSVESDPLGSISPNEEIYEGCGSSKACFGLPYNCVSRTSCDILASVAKRDSKFEFELMGKGVKYVSVLLSENGLVNDDSATSCVLVNNSVQLIQPFYSKYQIVNSDSSESSEAMINSSYVDGVLYCKFLRDETVEFNSVQYDLRSSEYFLILAAGNVKNGKEIIDLDKMQYHISTRKKYLSDVSEFSVSTKSTSVSDKKHGFHNTFYNWFFGIFDYFTMLR